MKFFTFFLFITMCFAFNMQSQNINTKRLKKIDSLKTALETEVIDTSKVNILNTICNIYRFLSDFESALVFGDRALTLSKKIVYHKGESRALYNIAGALKSKGDYKNSLDYNLKALEIREKTGDKKVIAANNAEIGTVYRLMGNFSKAMDHQLKGLKIRQESGDKMDIASSFNGIGSIYLDKGDYQKALESYLKSAKLSEEAGDKKDVASTYNNIANIYEILHKLDEALEFYLIALKLNEKNGNLRWKAVNLNNIAGIYSDKNNFAKSIEYYHQSLAIKEQIGDKGGIGSTLMNMGIAYGNHKDHLKAVEYANRALKLREEIGDKGGIAESLRSLGPIYSGMGEYKKGIEVLNSGIKLSNEIGARGVLQQCYFNLSWIYEKMNDQKNALKYYKLSSTEKDSILNRETNKSMTAMSAQFDSEKKDNEIKLLNKDKEKQEALTTSERKKQKIIIASVSAGMIFMLVFVFFVYRSYRQKKKDNIEITRQKEIIEEKNLEVRASITYAKRIQTAILPSDKIMQETLPDSFIVFKPKDIVSGDFYWMQKIESKILFAVVDCTGHGVPGALVSVVGHNALNRSIKEFELTSPAAILDKLNFLVEETFESSENEVKDGMDISLCCLDLDTNKLEWAGANNPLWIMNESGITELKGDKQPIGKFINRKPFTGHSIQLQKNDSIYIFTDGLADQFGGPKGKKFKYKQIKQLLFESNSDHPDLQKEKVLQALITWKGNLEQVDDICVMGVRI